MSRVPSPPKGLNAAGRRLWRAVVTDYDLAQHELAILGEAARVADLCEELQAVVTAEGLLADGKVHPAVVEARQQRILLARLIVALRVPMGDVEDDEPGRLQYRGARGVYALRTGS